MYHTLQKEYVFSNRYGKLVVEAVTGIVSVRNVRARDLSNELKFDFKTAEQIALITENNHTQFAFERTTAGGDYAIFLMLHIACSEVVVVKIKSLVYNGPNPQEEVERLNRLAFPFPLR